MDLSVKHLNFWFPNCQNSTVQQALAQSSEPHLWPKLDFIPAMQRRRLSPFAKIALHVANQTAQHSEAHLPIIFSSRHGDLHKTSELLADLAAETELSPTAFSLSVHNAIPSLYSIFTDNKQAINAISAGKDTFFMGLVDAYARLASGNADKILFIHVDQQLPETYVGFKDEIQLSHAVAMIVTLPCYADEDDASSIISINMAHQPGNDNEHLPGALMFAQWLASNTKTLSFNSVQYLWSVSRDV